MDYPYRSFVKDMLVEFVPYPSQRLIMLFQGLPSVPCDSSFLFYLSQRFRATVFYPRYPGTWESTGTFDKSLLKQLFQLPKLRKLKDCYTGEIFQFSFNNIMAMGHSFGGMVSLYLLGENKVDKAVSIAAPWKLTKIKEHYKYIKECFGSAYRLGEPSEFSLDPEKLKGKKFLLFHSKDDPIVPFEDVKQFLDLFPEKTRILDGYGHGGKKQIIKRYSRTIEKLFKDG